MPRADQATKMAAKALATGQPICILMPTDIVHLIAQNLDGSTDGTTQSIVDAVNKVQLMAPLHTWLIANVPDSRSAVYIGEAATPPPGIERQANAEVGTIQEWIPEQAVAMKSEGTSYKA